MHILRNCEETRTHFLSPHLHFAHESCRLWDWKLATRISFNNILYKLSDCQRKNGLSDLFETMLLLGDYVLDHHGHRINPGDHHAQRHHVLNHKQKTAIKSSRENSFCHTMPKYRICNCYNKHQRHQHVQLHTFTSHFHHHSAQISLMMTEVRKY